METLAPRKSEVYDRELRAYNDATTWLAETLNGRMRTSFEYRYDGRELYASDGGPVGLIFKKSLYDAYALAEKNPDLHFELRRRQIELEEYGDMLKMASGGLSNTMITVSDFPPELMNSTKDVGGYNSSRKQAMLRVITRTPDGRLRMQSQSLDGSNREALEAIYASFGRKPSDGELLGQRIHSDQDENEQAFLIDKLTGVYDHSLQIQNPRQRFQAGRRLPDTPDVETYQFVCSQPELVNYLAEKMLAGEMDEQTMFQTAATMASRYEKGGKPVSYNVAGEIIGVAMPLAREMYVAASRARATGATYSGCGASVSGALGAEGQLGASGFGNKATADDCEFTSKECPKCHKKNVKTVAKNGKFYGACGCHS